MDILDEVLEKFGRMKRDGVMMAWDYARRCALPEAELIANRVRWEQSEEVRWRRIREGVANRVANRLALRARRK